MLAEQVAVFYPDLMDPRCESAFAIYHQRYSTNTFPRWWLAQPFRMLAHNGEINTLKGNLNWLKSHEIRMSSDSFGELAEDIKPIVLPGSSDSAALDNVFEVMVRAGRSAPMAKTMLVPEAWSKLATKMPQSWLDMYAYSNAVMEPWDGPAALAMTDGRWVCAGLDRNGLRPMRYVVTGDGLVIAGSEAGMVATEDMSVVEKGALGPGQLLAVDMAEGRLFRDAEIKDQLAASSPFGDWVGSITDLEELTRGIEERPIFEGAELRRRQIAAGYSIEELETILHAMAEDGKEAIGSMGDDTPPAVLSDRYRPLSHYFRQNFSQVTNPPIDSLREHRVMSLKTRFGNLKNVLDQDNSQTEILQLDSPFVSNARFAAMVRYFGDAAVEIDCTFPAGADPNALQAGLARIRAEAEEAVRAGANHIVLSDTGQRRDRVAMPMILATSAVHSWLTRKGLRTFTSLNVRSGECIDPHYFAVLIGGGATTVNAYLAEDSIADRAARGLIAGSLTEAIERYRYAIDQGLLKVMSKMGISVISSYRGGLNFEAVGLSRAMVAEYFPGMLSRISGIGVTGVQRQVEKVHALAWRGGDAVLPIGGFYKARRAGESHAWEAQAMHVLQSACDRGSYEIWKQYSRAMQARPPIHLRDLLDFQPKAAPVPLEQVESITAIRKRFVTPGMSLGALSPEAHKTLNVAMNRIGAKSDSRRGRRGPGALPPGAERRQPERPDQAGGERAVRGDGGVSQPLRGARDQDRPGREAGRGRAAARDQGDRADRAAPALDAGGQPDLAAAAPRHLLDRGPGAADLRPEADQPAGQGLRQAGQPVRGRDDRGRGGEGEGRRDPDLGAQRRHGGEPADLDQVRRAAVGDGALRGAPGADGEQPARPGDPAHRRGPADRAGHRDRGDARGAGVRHRHGVLDRDGLHHGAAVPVEHLPGRGVHPGPAAAREVHRDGGQGRQPDELLRPGGAGGAGGGRGAVDRRGDRAGGPADAGEPRGGAPGRSRPQPAPDQRRPGGAAQLRPPAAAAGGARHAGRADRAGRRAVLQGRREDAALLRGAEHAALDRDAGVEPHRAAASACATACSRTI